MCLRLPACAPPPAPGERRRRAGPGRCVRAGRGAVGTGDGGVRDRRGRAAGGFPAGFFPLTAASRGRAGVGGSSMWRGRAAEVRGRPGARAGGGGSGPGRHRSLRRLLRTPAQLLGGEAQGPPFVHQLRRLVAPGPASSPLSSPAPLRGDRRRAAGGRNSGRGAGVRL